MEASVSAARQKAASAALFIFAFVGFIASIIAVVSYFQPEDSGVLRVEITPNDFRIPLELAEPFAEGKPSRRLLDDLKVSFCEPPEASKADTGAKTNTTSKETADTSLCEQGTDVEWLGRWSSAYANDPGTLYEYEIENRGSAVAEQIRIAAPGVASVQIRRGASFTNIPEDKSKDYYSIPDLNPREKATVLIWMIRQSNEILDYEDAPEVTFSGATVKTEIFRRVPQGWWNVYDIFGTAPTWILVVVIVGIAILIVLALALIIAVFDALVKGKPLRSIFETPPSAAIPREPS